MAMKHGLPFSILDTNRIYQDALGNFWKITENCTVDPYRPIYIGMMLRNPKFYAQISKCGNRWSVSVRHVDGDHEINQTELVAEQVKKLILRDMNRIKPFWTIKSDDDETGAWIDMPINDIVQRMSWIDPGTFRMGSPRCEVHEHSNQKPQHRVTISQGFWLADTPCTQELWQAVMGDNPSRFNRDYGGGPQHPVENVSWLMVQDFLQKLNAQIAGYRFTLPTEAEWEYTCRAGTITPFSFGETINTDQVNYNGYYPYGDGEKGQDRKCTVPVKAMPANEWHLYGMHGNVEELCADTLRDYGFEFGRRDIVDPGLTEAISPSTNKENFREIYGNHGENLSERRATRGGSWFSLAELVKSAARDSSVLNKPSRFTGFRFVLRPNM